MFEKIKNLFATKPNTSEKGDVLKLESPNEEIEVLELDDNSFSYGLNIEENCDSIQQMVELYREIASNSEVEDGINEIVNDVVVEENGEIVKLNLDKTELSSKIKKSLEEEFEYILSTLSFARKGDEIIRQWYVDGRLYVHEEVDMKNLKAGIQKLKILSPFNITKVKEKKTGEMFYIYKYQKKKSENVNALQIPEEHIIFVSSGITDSKNKHFISHLQKCIRPFNQLKLLEDSAVVYRITRSPERRVFYIDVGKMTKTKAAAYMNGLMRKFKNKVVYDSTTGEVSQRKNVMTMAEDIWLPRTDGGKGTEVSMLQGGQSLGEITDIEYFKKKLLKSLKVPYSRLDTDGQATVSFDKSADMEREEYRFLRFVQKLRDRIGRGLLIEALRRQIILKNILTVEEWDNVADFIYLDWSNDSNFLEYKYFEKISNRLDLLNSINDYIGFGQTKYFTKQFVCKNILRMDDEEIEELEKQQEEEKTKYKSDSDEEEY